MQTVVQESGDAGVRQLEGYRQHVRRNVITPDPAVEVEMHALEKFDDGEVDLEADRQLGPPEQRNAVTSYDLDDGVDRTSNKWIAAAYNVTAIIGVGVLGLPHAMVFLTWKGGVVVLLLAFFITYFTMRQLVKLHDFELQNLRLRYTTYHSLGNRAFGAPWGSRIILPLQMVVEVSLDILFTIAAGEAMNRIHEYVQDGTPKHLHLFVWFAAFAFIQIVLSFALPSFESIKWIVIAAAVMSICYSTIAWITVVSAGATEMPHRLPSVLPVENVPASYSPASVLELSHADLVFQAFNAIGVIAFAYAAHNIVLEIQNGIPSTSLRESKTEMLHGVWITYVVVAICYFPMAIAVYAMRGNQISENILSFSMFQKGSASRRWILAANYMLILHLIGSYQIFAMPVFTQLEILFQILFERSSPMVIRPLYIVSTTFLAMVFPFFSPLLGFFGGFAIAPTTYFMPCIIWLWIKNPRRWSKEWCFNWACIILGVLLMIVASVGGLLVLRKDWRIFHYYKLWGANWRCSIDLYNEACAPALAPTPM